MYCFLENNPTKNSIKRVSLKCYCILIIENDMKIVKYILQKKNVNDNIS